jgi:hypothetical protein
MATLKQIAFPPICMLTHLACLQCTAALNNAMMAKLGHPLAAKHNKTAVLEAHSVDVCMQLLQQPECNFIASFSGEQQQRFKDTVKRLILATDMAVRSGKFTQRCS